MIWGMTTAFYVTFLTGCLLIFASDKTLMRNWIASVLLVGGVALGYMMGKS